MSDTRLATANLAGAFLSLTLFGFYTLLFITTVLVVVQRQNRTYRLYVVLTSLCVLFVTNAIDAAYTLDSIFNAFIKWPGGAADYFANGAGSNAVFLAFDDWSYVIASFAADGLLLWRLWVVWSRDKLVIIFPVLGLLLNFFGAWVIFALDIITASPSKTANVNHSFLIWEYVILANTVAINVFMTFSICFKLWRVSASVKRFRGRVDHPYNRIIGALVESGSLYTGVYAANLITLLGRHVSPSFAPAQTIIAYLNIRTAGIMPTLIVLYINTAGRKVDQRPAAIDTSMPVFNNTTISPTTDSQGGLPYSKDDSFALSSKRRRDKAALRQTPYGTSRGTETLNDDISLDSVEKVDHTPVAYRADNAPISTIEMTTFAGSSSQPSSSRDPKSYA